jgi:hypothetical protein
MNAIEAQLLKMFLPDLETMALNEWSTKGLPELTAKANALPKGGGQEEALILINALDQIMKFEASRQP